MFRAWAWNWQELRCALYRSNCELVTWLEELSRLSPPRFFSTSKGEGLINKTSGPFYFLVILDSYSARLVNRRVKEKAG